MATLWLPLLAEGLWHAGLQIRSYDMWSSRPVSPVPPISSSPRPTPREHHGNASSSAIAHAILHDSKSSTNHSFKAGFLSETGSSYIVQTGP